MITTEEKKFDIYFYNGFNEPKLVAKSIEEFEVGVKVTGHSLILDSIGSDLTDEIVENLKEYKQGKIYNEEIGGDIIVNPTIKELIAMNKRWFGRGRELTYLDKFIDKTVGHSEMEYMIEERFGSDVFEYDWLQEELDYYLSELGYEYIEDVDLYIKQK